MKDIFLNNKNLFYLFLGHLISHSGDAIYMIALPWLILDITNSTSTTSLVTMSAYLPSLLFGLISGGIVDRYSRKMVMIYSDILRAITVILIPVSLFLGYTSPLLLGILAFFLSLFGTPFYPARDSLIPQTVPSKHLTKANTIISASGQFAHVLGPLIAGLLVSMVGLMHLFTIDAITFLLSLVFIVLISDDNRIDRTINLGNTDFLFGGLKFLKSNQGLLILLILTLVNNFFIMGPAMIGIAVFVKNILNNSFVTLGIMEAAMATGMIFGSFGIWKFSNKFSVTNLLLFGIIFDGITFCPLYFVKSEFLAIIVMFIHGFGIPMITISRTLIIQKNVPKNMQGRIFSLFQIAVVGTTAFSIAVVGPILEYLTVNMLFLIIGIFAASCSLLGLLSSEFKNLNKN